MKHFKNTKSNNINNDTLISRVEKLLTLKFFINDNSTLLIAVSGGVDSIVLLDIIYKISIKKFYHLNVAHYNHSLRGKSSNEDAAFVREISEKYNLPFYLAKGRVSDYAKKNSISIEESARHLRYLFLVKTARTIGSQFILTAHTSDDCAETFLINLFRGSGLTGLGGIQPIRIIAKNIAIIRPLLEFKKSDLIEYARRNNLQWREDESNRLAEYTRNKIRLELIPKLENEFNPSVVDNINRAANLINSADEFISQFVTAYTSEIASGKSPDRIKLKTSLLITHSNFIQGEIIQKILEKYFQLQSVSMKTIDSILALTMSESGAYIKLTSNISVLKDRNSLIIERQKLINKIYLIINKEGKYKINDYEITLKEVDKSSVALTNDKNIEYFDYDLIPVLMTLRTWENGDSFTPLGMKGKVKISDFLINEKVPLSDKPKILLLTAKSDVIWVCGMRINDKYKITNKTKRYLKAKYKSI